MVNLLNNRRMIIAKATFYHRVRHSFLLIVNPMSFHRHPHHHPIAAIHRAVHLFNSSNCIGFFQRIKAIHLSDPHRWLAWIPDRWRPISFLNILWKNLYQYALVVAVCACVSSSFCPTYFRWLDYYHPHHHHHLLLLFYVCLFVCLCQCDSDSVVFRLGLSRKKRSLSDSMVVRNDWIDQSITHRIELSFWKVMALKPIELLFFFPMNFEKRTRQNRLCLRDIREIHLLFRILSIFIVIEKNRFVWRLMNTIMRITNEGFILFI